MEERMRKDWMVQLSLLRMSWLILHARSKHAMADIAFLAQGSRLTHETCPTGNLSAMRICTPTGNCIIAQRKMPNAVTAVMGTQQNRCSWLGWGLEWSSFLSKAQINWFFTYFANILSHLQNASNEPTWYHPSFHRHNSLSVFFQSPRLKAEKGRPQDTDALSLARRRSNKNAN